MKAGWTIKPLGGLCKTGAGGTPLKSIREYYEGGDVPWLLSGEVSQGEITEATNFITQKGLENSSAKLFPPNTVLVAMYGATAGQVGILRFEASTNQAVCGILPSEHFLPEFLFYFFLHKKDELVAQAAGNAQPNISQIKIRNMGVPTAPLPEQHRIVAILDEAFDGIATAKANAEKNLQNARALFESHLQSVFTERGEGWVEKRLDDLYRIGSSKRVLKSQWMSEGVPFYRGREVTKLAADGRVENELFISEEHFAELAKQTGVPTAGDIVITAIGTIGNAHIVRDEDRFYFKDASVLWMKRTSDICSKFTSFWLKSALFIDQLDRGNGATVDTLTIQRLQSMKICIPSVSMQQEIVTALSAVREETQRLESLYQQKLAALDDLKKSLLHQAFSGAL